MNLPIQTLEDAQPPQLIDAVSLPSSPADVEEQASNRSLTPAGSAFGKVRHLLGLDRAIGFTLLARGWSSFAGLVTLRLIARHLSLEEQGFYYTFGSLVALQIVFELGFSTVILQLASHEVAHLQILPDGTVSGSLVAHQRLASVLQKSVRWYLIASLLMVCSVIPAGIFFFSGHRQSAQPVVWLMPWCAVVLAASLTFQVDPVFSFLEGCGFVPQIARTRFWQAVAGTLLAWSALLLHRGLFAPALLISGQAIAGFAWLLTRRKLLVHLFCYPSGENRITWKEVWPFQWRIAVSWLCGYFITQLFNPVLFVFWGAAAAGQMGMSLTLMGAVASISIAWVYTKAAPFGQMIARKEYARLDSIFFRALFQSVILCASGDLLLWYGDVYLHAHHSPYAARILPPLPFAILLAVSVLNQIVASEALYLRAHKQEKFLIPSVVGAACTAFSTYFLGRYYAALGMVCGFFIVAIFVGIGFGSYTFFKYRRLWHRESDQDTHVVSEAFPSS